MNHVNDSGRDKSGFAKRTKVSPSTTTVCTNVTSLNLDHGGREGSGLGRTGQKVYSGKPKGE